MFQKLICWKCLHTLPAKEHEVAAIHNEILNSGVWLVRMFPMHRSLTIYNGEGEESIAMEVGTIHCQLAREGNRGSGNQTRGREEENK